MRLDQYLVEKGYVSSREKAQAIIMAGLVYVDGKPITKSGTKIKEGQIIEVKEPPKYVSRGGYKLEWAMKRFGLDVKDMTALDVGSSTGGFTQCLLMHGVKKVYAVDVGKGQMDSKLRSDPRVVLYEKTDARELTERHIPEPVDLIVMDVSFISTTKLIPHVIKFLKEGGLLLVLVKPQFEVGPEKVKKGIVREKEDKKRAVLRVAEFLASLGFYMTGVVKSKPKGTKGNEEFFILSGKHLKALENLEEAVEYALKEAI